MNHTDNRKVLIVGEFGTLNGGEKSFLAIASSLIEMGWELIAGVPASRDDAESEFAEALNTLGIKIHDWNVRPGGKPEDRKQLPQIRAELAAIIRQTKPAIVHYNSLSTSRLGGPVTNELQIPSLGYLRDIMKLSKAVIADINFVDNIIAVSQATKDWHVAQGIETDKTFVVHNGVDSVTFAPNTDAPTPTGIRNELSIPASDRVLLFVGQIGRRKGVDLLAESFLSIAKTDPTVHLLVVGQRHSQKLEAIEYEEEIVALLKDPNVCDRVHFLGRRGDVAEIMQESDILVHPARQEPLGRVLLEASASGLVIATTDVGGSAEIIVGDGETSELAQLLVPPHDAIALSELIRELLSNPTKLDKLGNMLRLRAISHFPVKTCVSQIDSHYRTLAGFEAKK